eukprot:s910_g13.t1
MQAMLWHALALLALCNGQLTTEEEIQVLSDADQQLFDKVQDTRRFINGQLIEVIEVLSEKVDENRREIRNLAEMTQKSLKQIRQKVNQHSDQLGEAEDFEHGMVQEFRNWSTTWPATTARNRSHHRVKEEIAQLKGEVSQVNKTNQRLQQKLLQKERDAATSVSSESSAAKEVQAFQRDIWLHDLAVALGLQEKECNTETSQEAGRARCRSLSVFLTPSELCESIWQFGVRRMKHTAEEATENHDEDKKIDDLRTEFGQFIADTDTKMNQLEAQLHKSESNEARINSLDERSLLSFLKF